MDAPRHIPLLTLILLILLAVAAPAVGQSHSWATTTSGNWSVPGNWSPSGVPNGAGMDATISATGAPYTVTLDLDVLLDGLTLSAPDATLAASSRTLTLNGPATFGPGTVDWTHGLVDGTGLVTNTGDWILRGAPSIHNLDQQGLLWVRGGNSGGHATATVVNSFTNTGTVRLESGESTWASNLVLGSGALLTNDGGIESLQGSGGTRLLSGDVDNAGTMLVDWTLSLSGGTFTNRGAVTVSAGQQLSLDSTGTFRQESGTLDVTGSFLGDGATFEGVGGAITGQAGLRNGSLVFEAGSTLSGLVALFGGSSTLTGDVPAGSTVLVQGSNLGGTATTTVAGSSANAGTIRLQSADSTWPTNLAIPGGTLSNDGQVEILVGTGGNRSVSGALLNRGTVTVDTATAWTVGPFTNEGTFDIQSGGALTVSGATFQQNSGSLGVAGAMLISGGSLRWLDGAGTGFPALRNSALVFETGAAGTGEIHLEGASSTLEGDVPAGLLVWCNGNNRGGNATTTVLSSLANQGTLRLESSDSTYASRLIVQGGSTLTNQGTLEIRPGPGGDRTVSGAIANEGTVRVETGTTWDSGPFSNSGSFDIVSGGGLTISSADFQQSSGSLDIAGAMLHSGGSLHWLDGTMTGYAQVRNAALGFDPGATGTGEIHFEGASSTLEGDVPAGLLVWCNGNMPGSHATITVISDVTNAGTLRMESSDSSYASNVTVASGMTLTNQGTIEVRVGSAGPRTLTGALDNQGAFQVDHPLTIVDGPITNSGAWAVGATGAVGTGSGVTIHQDGGSLDVSGSFVHSGGVFEMNDGVVTGPVHLVDCELVSDSASAASGVLRVSGSSAKLTGGVGASTEVWIRGSLTGSNAVLTLPASLTNAGTIRMESADSSYNDTLQIDPGVVLTNAGQIVVGVGAGGSRTIQGELVNLGDIQVDYGTGWTTGPVTNQGRLGVAAGATLTFGAGTQGPPAFVQSSGSLDLQGTLQFPSGTFQLDGGDVSGTLLLASSTLDLGAGSTATGTVRLSGASILQGEIPAGLMVMVQGRNYGSNASVSAPAGLTNRGTVHLESADSSYNSTLAVSGGPLLNQGTLSTAAGSGGVRTVTAELANAGTVDVAYGTTFDGAGTTMVNTGSFLVSDPGATAWITNTTSFENQNGGIVGGVGTLDVNATTLNNNATIAPGMSAGILHIAGDLHQAANGIVEIQVGGPTPGTEHDVLEVSGTANLDGTLRIKKLSGFKPSVGDQATVLTAGSISGQFAGVDVSEFAQGLTVELSYTATTVTAKVVFDTPDHVIGAQQKVLVLSDPVPGVAGQTNTFTVTGCSANASANLVFGTASGSTGIPGCPSATFDIAAAQLGGSATASGNGTALIDMAVSSSASGMTVLFQAAEPESCRVSNLVSFTFP